MSHGGGERKAKKETPFQSEGSHHPVQPLLPQNRGVCGGGGGELPQPVSVKGVLVAQFTLYSLVNSWEASKRHRSYCEVQ